LSGELRELAGLLVFCEDRPTRATLEQERALLLHPSIPAERRSRLIWSAVLFATRHFPVELILDVYQRERTMIREMPFIQEWEQEARALGLAEGRTEGKAEGKAEGIAEGILTGAKNLFLTLARQRLGEPNPQAASYLAGLHDPNEIQRLGARMLEVESWDELLP
jgi:predicted transposase YdaD